MTEKLTPDQVEEIVSKALDQNKKPNLAGANLRGINLCGVNLSKADLSGADLYKADLREADLSGVNLTKADLREAYLKDAHLDGANLTGTDLTGADLTGAYLCEANLSRADLSKVNLSQADLSQADLSGGSLGVHYSHPSWTVPSGANLSDVTLQETNFSQARLGVTSLLNLDLRQAQGLETIKHLSSSSISTDTLIKSQGQIPEIFLRGCGFSDWEIENVKLYRPNLSAEEITDIVYKLHELKVGQAIQMAPCFISYTTQDQALAEKLHNDLQTKGIRCWYAPEDLVGGRKLDQQIDEAIRLHDVFLLIISEASMESEWVKDEISRAIAGKFLAQEIGEEVSEGSRLFPIRLIDFEHIAAGWSDFGFGDDINQYYIPDWRGWQDETIYSQLFERLLRDITR